MRRVGRGLQYGRAAGRNGRYERVEQQLHGIVPRRDDKRYAQRLDHDAAARGEHLQRRAPALRTRPAAQMPQMISDLVSDDAQLGHVRLLAGLVKIGGQSVAKRLLPPIERIGQSPQHLAAVCGVERRAAAEKISLFGYGGLYLLGGILC